MIAELFYTSFKTVVELVYNTMYLEVMWYLLICIRAGKSRKMGASGRVRVSLKIQYQVGSGRTTVSSVKVFYSSFMMVSYCLLLAYL